MPNKLNLLWMVPALVLSVVSPLVAQGEQLDVLDGWAEWSDASSRLQRYLNAQAFELLAERRSEIQRLTSASDWKARQKDIRDRLQRALGPFPEKTPLNARVLGTVKKPGYRIEKIVFESQPRFYVTGCLFLPESGGEKRPAILNVIGHTDIAFRAAGYQQLLLNLVRKGFIVFAMDPIGQGERLQYYDPQLGRSQVGRPTSEHSYLGVQAFLSGSSAARYFTWDGIRAIDFLVNRPEVDADRIGVTGISGGGTQTTYIAALDERVAAASPSCYIAGFQRLLESIGPQDAEQNLNLGLFHGLDHADFLEVRAPRPTQVTATTRDFFSIQGARETVGEVRRAFEALGAGDNLWMAEDDHGHGYTTKTREATYAFFQKHLGLPGDPSDQPIDPLTLEDLRVTPSGQLIGSLGGETVFSLNRKEAEHRLAALETARKEAARHLQAVRTRSREISGFEPAAPGNIVFRGRYRRPGLSIEQHVIAGPGGLVVPVLLFIPDGVSRPPALLYLHPGGKSAAAQPGGDIEWLARRGYAVLAPDLSGTGELGQVSNDLAFLGALTGRSIAALQAADILRCLEFLGSQSRLEEGPVRVVARGIMNVPLLHAAAQQEGRIGETILIEPLLSYRSVVMNRFYQLPPAALVANALTAYDLPDLAATLAPIPLRILNPVDQSQSPATQQAAETELSFPIAVYTAAKARQNLEILTGSIRPVEETLSAWLKSP